jgi:hypothetical protein
LPFRTDIKTRVTFETSDKGLQRLFDTAVAKAQANLVRFTPSTTVLVEGGGYANAWLETQPMGGEMFARHDVQVALNNQVVFMLGQREDGRLPGMVIAGDTVTARGWDENPREGYAWYPEHHLAASYEMFQGYCFPEPAWRMYFWAGKDRAYLRRLYAALEAHDAYLWRTRDSDGDGILETWCVWDTGEDGSTRLATRGAPSRWPFEKPPGAEGLPGPRTSGERYWFYPDGDGLLPSPDEVLVPFASMDVMAYSYAGRAALSKIARELGNGKEADWRAGAEDVRRRLIDKLWVAERHACFDLDRTGRRLEELVHNNLRCMWYGIFTQRMADAFVSHHLLNADEFWTPIPLVSIAANESLFRNGRRNDWSGQPQGLTYQRAIGALENYGHYAEVTLLGRKLLPVLIRNGCTFTQQLDPFTGEALGRDGYGPMILAALEYINRMHGIHLEVEHDRVWWSGLAPGGHDFTRSQRWGETTWALRCRGGQLSATVNGKEAFTATAGARIVTDLDGRVLEAVGIDPQPRNITVKTGSREWKLTVRPNQVCRLDDAIPVADVRFGPGAPRFTHLPQSGSRSVEEHGVLCTRVPLKLGPAQSLFFVETAHDT